MRFIEAGHCEFIEDFAGALPMDVISEMLGVPRPDRSELRKLADLVVHREPDNPEVPEAGMQAAAKMLRYFADHVIAARKEPKDDLTGALILAEVEGDQLVDPEIISFLFLMIIAGNETTTKLLGNALYWLGRNPDAARQSRRQPGPDSRLGRRDPALRRLQPIAWPAPPPVTFEIHGRSTHSRGCPQWRS